MARSALGFFLVLARVACGLLLLRTPLAAQPAAALLFRPLRACGSCLNRLVTHPCLRLLDKKLLNRRRKDRPLRIILVRHGESEGNLNRSIYTTTPDSQVRLTERGYEQGVAAGKQIRSLTGSESVAFFYSPYLRTKQTLHGALHAWRGHRVELISEPRLREQDFGNFQDVQIMRHCMDERRRFGRLWYRFPNGEAGSDVYGRVGDLWAALKRIMDHPRDRPARNLVLVTHGLLMRFVCMFYLGWSEHEFEQVWNPTNGEVWVLEKQPETGRYELRGRWEGFGRAFKPIRFGPTQSQLPYPHMMRCQPRRFRLPLAPDELRAELDAALGGGAALPAAAAAAAGVRGGGGRV